MQECFVLPGVYPAGVGGMVFDESIVFVHGLLVALHGAQGFGSEVMGCAIVGGICGNVAVKGYQGNIVLGGIIIHQPAVQLIHRDTGIHQGDQG